MTDATETLPATTDAEPEAALAVAREASSPNALAEAVIAAPRHLLPAPLDELRKAAYIIAMGNNAPVAFQGHPDKCLSIAYQAALWGMDPVAVASKCYLVPVKGGVGGERLAYEAQLIKALILAKVAFEPGHRLRVTYYGAGAQRYAVASGVLLGETEPSTYSSPIVGQITPKNSPLWVTDVDQQLDYYACRAWCRRHRPDVILGVYSPDEFPRYETMQDVTPRKSPYAPQIAQATDVAEAEEQAPSDPENPAVVDVQPDPPPPSGGRGVVNRDDKSKTTKAGGVKAADIGPNPWPDVEDIMEWLAGFRAEVAALKEHSAMLRIWAQAKAHGLLSRLKTVSKADFDDLAGEVEQIVKDLMPPEE